MGLTRRNGGPYAPRRKAQPNIDWQREFALRDAENARIVQAEELAHSRMIEERLKMDPINQLVERCHSIEQDVAALKGRMDLIIKLLQGDVQ